MQKPLGGTPLAIYIWIWDFFNTKIFRRKSLAIYFFGFLYKIFKGISLTICDFRIYFTQNSLGGQPLRSTILVFEIYKKLRMTPLAI